MLCRERRVARSLFRARQKARCKPFPAIGTECDVFLLVRERAFSGCFAGHIPRAKEPADQDHGRICTAGRPGGDPGAPARDASTRVNHPL